jgi:hypothetical protein
MWGLLCRGFGEKRGNNEFEPKRFLWDVRFAEGEATGVETGEEIGVFAGDATGEDTGGEADP